MSNENPFKKQSPIAEKMAGDLELEDEATEPGADEIVAGDFAVTSEASPESIENAERTLGEATNRLEGNLAKPINEKKIKDPDTWEKIQSSWEKAKFWATGVYIAGMGTLVAEMATAGHEHQIAVKALGQGFDAERAQHLAEMMEAVIPGTTVAAFAIPALIFVLGKAGEIGRERSLGMRRG